MLLWGQSYNAGHLWLAEESRLQECSWHWGELIRSCFLHPWAGLSFYSWSYFLSCINCGEVPIYFWKQGLLSQVTAALCPVGGHTPVVLAVTEARILCGESLRHLGVSVQVQLCSRHSLCALRVQCFLHTLLHSLQKCFACCPAEKVSVLDGPAQQELLGMWSR